MVAIPLLSRQARSCTQEEMTSALKCSLPDEKSCLPVALHLASCISRASSESKALCQHSVFSIPGSREGQSAPVNQDILESTSSAWAGCAKPPGLCILPGSAHNELFPNGEQHPAQRQAPSRPKLINSGIIYKLITGQSPSISCHGLHWLLARDRVSIHPLPLLGKCRGQLELCLSKVWLRWSYVRTSGFGLRRSCPAEEKQTNNSALEASPNSVKCFEACELRRAINNTINKKVVEWQLPLIKIKPLVHCSKRPCSHFPDQEQVFHSVI